MIDEKDEARKDVGRRDLPTDVVIALQAKLLPVELDQQHWDLELLRHSFRLTKESPRFERRVKVGDRFSFDHDVRI